MRYVSVTKFSAHLVFYQSTGIKREMARYLNSAIVFLAVLVLSYSSAYPRDGFSLSLENRLQQLTENYLKMKQIVEAMELKIEKQQETIIAHQQQINERPTNSVPLAKPEIPYLTHPLAATGIPKSCSDLNPYMGHTWNGLYLIMGTEQVETVYCDFAALPSDPSFQKWIGQVNVKSQPVYFYVQKNTSFYEFGGTPIPFELEVLNIGNAMDLESGLFTAPRAGTYHFAFTGSAKLPGTSSREVLGIAIFLNRNRVIGNGFSDQISADPQNEVMSIHATLKLKAGDVINLQFFYASTGAYLEDNNTHLSHFSGWLLEEDISQSLV